MSSIKQDESSSPKYWRSLDQLADSTEFRSFVENEFPASADQMMTPASRRNFLKLMGASMALAGMTACRWPREEILPFSERPEGYVPGTPRHFATAMEFAGVAGGVVVTSYDGRPVKIEGNDLHPDSLGSSDVRTQASLLELYDPERSNELLRKDDGGQSATDWSAFDAFADGHFAELRKDRGRGLRVLAGADSSPTLRRMRERFAETFPEAGWVEYEAISRDNIRTGTRMLWGRALRPHWDLKRAQLIVSFDDDFLAQHPNAVRYSRDLIEGRSPDAHDFSRLIIVEGCYSMTGCVADRRLVVDTQAIPAYVGCVAAHLFLEEGLELPSGMAALRPMLEGFRSHELYGTIDRSMLHDLLAHRGASVLTVGPGQPAEVHALVGVLNLALGNIGETVTFTAETDADRNHHHSAMGTLIEEMQAGSVETLVILEGNPLFDAPADLDFAGALQKVGTVIRAGRFVDETSAAADWHLPLTHYLETWGDGLGYRGTYSVGQPLIEPLRNGRPKIELVAAMLGHPQSAYEAVQATLTEQFGGDRWRGALHDGLVQDSEAATVSPGPARDRWCGALAAHSSSTPDGYHLVFLTDTRIHDGRFANNGWLQELPDSVTKLTWDNAALVGPTTAAALGVEHGQLLQVEHAGHRMELPVYILPGQAPRTIGVAMGYGRRQGGQIAVGAGFDVYPLRSTHAMWVAPVQLRAAAGSYPLATTQNHFAIDSIGTRTTEERAPVLVREIDLEDLRGGHHDPQHGTPVVDLWEPHVYEGYKWGMSIDLNSCTGCNACIIACQAENNIPVVGKDEIARGREMHWIRVDRYFQGGAEAPKVSFQPVTCQHCENAPCEQVCPVAATVHDAEGLNVMVYNRCVGTRYCANNCPYKVRRFNYFNNHLDQTPLETMVYNPQVSIRSRGVMEKCSFCIQRIAAAKIVAGNEDRKVRDGEIIPACGQACPTRAITFGDLNDEDSRVRALQKDSRSYAMLEEINVRPRLKYMSRVRNPGHTEAGEA